MGRISEVKQGGNTIATYSYDGLSNLENETYGNGVINNKTYDGLNRIQSMETLNSSSEAVFFEGYEYDAVSNRTATKNSVGETTVEYGFDFMDQLVSVDYKDTPESNINYAYDYRFNRTSLASDIQNHSYQYDPDTDELTKLTFNTQSNIDFTYNPNGSLTKETYVRAGNNYKERNFTYDYEERLQQVEIVDKSAGVPQLDTTSRVNFAYDDFGNRIKKEVEGGDTKYYLNQGLDLLAELDASGNMIKNYVYGVDLIGTVDSEGNFKYTVQDSLGSTRVLTDDQGNKITEKTYDPYGSVEYMESSGPLSDSVYEAIGFTNQEKDPETGLIYMNARYYNPVIGRFITEDLYKGNIGDAKSLNHYTYAANNPLKYTDPTGMWTFDDEGNAYSECRDDGQPETLAYLVWVLTGNPIEDFPGIEEHSYNTQSIKKIALEEWRKVTFPNWETWMWEDILLEYDPKWDNILDDYFAGKETPFGQDNAYGRKVGIKWMIDRTSSLHDWMIKGANEMDFFKADEDIKWSYVGYKKYKYLYFANKVHDYAEYDIKRYTEYQNLLSSGCLIGDTIIPFDAPGNFLFGYLGAATKIPDKNLELGATGFQILKDSIKTYFTEKILHPNDFTIDDLINQSLDSVLNEAGDQHYVSLGYDFYNLYGKDFDINTLADYFNTH